MNDFVEQEVALFHKAHGGAQAEVAVPKPAAAEVRPAMVAVSNRQQSQIRGKWPVIQLEISAKRKKSPPPKKEKKKKYISSSSSTSSSDSSDWSDSSSD